MFWILVSSFLFGTVVSIVCLEFFDPFKSKKDDDGCKTFHSTKESFAEFLSKINEESDSEIAYAVFGYITFKSELGGIQVNAKKKVFPYSFNGDALCYSSPIIDKIKMEDRSVLAENLEDCLSDHLLYLSGEDQHVISLNLKQ